MHADKTTYPSLVPADASCPARLPPAVSLVGLALQPAYPLQFERPPIRCERMNNNGKYVMEGGDTLRSESCPQRTLLTGCANDVFHYSWRISSHVRGRHLHLEATRQHRCHVKNTPDERSHLNLFFRHPLTQLLHVKQLLPYASWLYVY